ncbi:MAG: hypothetical protein ABJA82_07275 [Myxococcales bacterium]
MFSQHRGTLMAVPIVATSRSAVRHHHVVRVTLESGRIVEMSAGHPTTDGRTFGDLIVGAYLGSVRVAMVQVVAYEHPFTYDILPASDSGTYVAAGALVGSTMAAERSSVVAREGRCIATDLGPNACAVSGFR